MMMRLEAEFLDEYEDTCECQLRVETRPLGGLGSVVILINMRDMEDLFDGTYLISERALQAYGLL